MKTIARYSGFILMAMTLMMFVSCHPEEPVENIDYGVPVYPVIYSSSSSFPETRALPQPGWQEYSHTKEYQRVPTTIQSFFDHSTRARSGVFSYAATESDPTLNTWTSGVRIDPDNTEKYTVFGYMPSTLNGTLTKDDGTGVYTLNFTNLNPVSKEDFMVIVGVGRTASDVTLGNHSYEGKDGTAGNENNLVLMVDHMYAGVDFQFKLDGTYSQLRTVKITEIVLSTPSTQWLNGSVTFTPTTEGGVTTYSMSEPSYTEVTSQGSPDVVNIVLNPPLTLTTDYQTVHGYLVPVDQNKLVNGRYFLSMTTKYEVYDKGTPEVLLSERTATNAITLSPPDGQTSLNRGTKYVLQSIVAPTYLYQLSDNDLNNPTLTFN